MKITTKYANRENTIKFRNVRTIMHSLCLDLKFANANFDGVLKIRQTGVKGCKEHPVNIFIKIGQTLSAL